MRAAPAFGLLCAALVLSACTPTAPPTASPVPSVPVPTCTPEAGGSPVPCTQSEYEHMQQRNALYTEAEQVYRQLFAEEQRLFREGLEADEATLKLVQGQAEELVRRSHAGGAKMEGGETRLVWVQRLTGASKDGSTIAIETCVDNSATVMKNEGDPEPGVIALERAYFAPTTDGLKAVFLESKVVDAC